MKTMRVIRDEAPLKPRKEVKPSMKTLLDKTHNMQDKAILIETYNPNFYVFGKTLTPTNPYQGEEDENT
jgi:hypothetical protein